MSAGLDAELAAAPEIEKKAADDQKKADAEQKAYEKAKADYDKAYEKYSKCRDKVADRGPGDVGGDERQDQQGGASSSPAASTSTKLMALAEKAQAASQRISEGKGTAEDRKTLAEFQAMMNPISANAAAAGASMQEASAFNQGAAARIEKACGKEPQPPKEPGSATSPEGQLLNAGAKGAKMDPQDYMVARELVIQWAGSNTVVAGGGGGGGGGGAAEESGKSDPDAQNQAIREAAGKICAMRKAKIPT